jgi:hypothetical protein
MVAAVDTNSCTIHEVPLGRSIFGAQLGAAPAPCDLCDTVESVSSNTITLVSRGFDFFERSILDLNEDTFRVMETQSEWRRPRLDGKIEDWPPTHK